ncbi:MAG: formate hydrogenlyase [Gammaproteobacteria bacterium]|nr:MAG: formate hydrogenlyase [Gammaproteobacteria bacterium]
MSWLLALAQALLFAALAPLAAGWVAWLKARLQNRRGAPPWQPYRELARLFAKEVRIARQASPLFAWIPFVVFGATWVATATVPLVSTAMPTAAVADVIALAAFLALGRFFLALGGLDVGTAFGGMGSSREMLVSALAEPAMLMAVFTLAMVAHSTNLATVIQHQLEAPLLLRPSYVFALAALLLVAVAETGRIPVDNPTTHLELTMVHEAMLLEYAGKHLALMEWAAQLKLLLYGVLLVNVFLPWGIATDLGAGALAVGLAAVLLKLALLGAVLAVAETVLAKMRLFRVPAFLNLAFLLALLGMLSHVILEVGGEVSG